MSRVPDILLADTLAKFSLSTTSFEFLKLYKILESKVLLTEKPSLLLAASGAFLKGSLDCCNQGRILFWSRSDQTATGQPNFQETPVGFRFSAILGEISIDCRERLCHKLCDTML